MFAGCGKTTVVRVAAEMACAAITRINAQALPGELVFGDGGPNAPGVLAGWLADTLPDARAWLLLEAPSTNVAAPLGQWAVATSAIDLPNGQHVRPGREMRFGPTFLCLDMKSLTRERWGTES
jgi:hypothetical protein